MRRAGGDQWWKTSNMTTGRKQVALVTGGRSGIGQACARNLATQGIRVFTAQRQDDPEFDSICADLADTDGPPSDNRAHRRSRWSTRYPNQ